jgi:TFIIF-interacting CTD phosphatase-like protein
LVKDLCIFQRNLARVILVDNGFQSFLLQPQNGVLIKT